MKETCFLTLASDSHHTPPFTPEVSTGFSEHVPSILLPEAIFKVQKCAEPSF